MQGPPVVQRSSADRYASFATGIGTCGIRWRGDELTGVQLPARSAAALEAALSVGHAEPAARIPRWVGRTMRDLQRSLTGVPVDLGHVPLAMGHLPPFRARLYAELRRVPRGRTISYGQLARLSDSRSARATGTAVGKNPFPLVVPCHRVVRSNGDVGEFSAFGGAATKRRLLALEGIHLPLQHGLCFEPSVALKHLREVDPRLGVLIDRVGRFDLNPSTSESTFAALLRAIIYQQLAGAAAAAIYRRVLAALPHQHVTAARVAATSDEALRAAGLSRPKLRSIRDLAERALADEVPDTRQLYVQSDDMIVEMLTPIRGIGRWTVEMLLIRLGRPDVLPTSDFGIRRGFGRWFLGGRMPSERHVARRGERWRPYRTAASWYLWRAADANVDLDGD